MIPKSEADFEETNIALTAAMGRPRTVLDVGCGLGFNGMVAKGRGARVVGIEEDPIKAERAQRLLDEVIRVDFRNASAVRQTLGQHKFDLIVFPEILELVDDPAATLREFTEYLEPEGHVILSLRNREVWNARLNLLGPELGYRAAGGPSHFYDRTEAREIARRAGLQPLQVTQNPMLARSVRPLILSSQWVAAPRGEETGPAYRELPVYRAYRAMVRPFEDAFANVAPRLLAYQHIVVARKQPKPGPVSLTVGMLTMDEEESIERMMDEIHRYAPDAKILCVDSSMKDQTPVIAERMGARVIRQLPPRGHGPAMEVLMYEASRQSEALIYLDCDFTYPPSVIPQIRRILDSGVDVVNAARTRTRPKAMPLANYMANKTFAMAGRLSSGAPVSDLHSGMRGYRSSVIRAFSFDGEGDALPIDTLLWPAKCGYHVVDIPIDYQERVGFSKLRKVAGTVWTFVRLGKTLGVGKRGSGQYDDWDSDKLP
jgi:SAM-dependent methyltransferase